MINLALDPDLLVINPEKSKYRGALSFHSEKWNKVGVQASLNNSLHQYLGRFNNSLPSASVESDLFH